MSEIRPALIVGGMDFEKYASEMIEWTALMAEAGMRLLESLDDGGHDESAAMDLLEAILGLHHLDERYELEWWFRES